MDILLHVGCWGQGCDDVVHVLAFTGVVPIGLLASQVRGGFRVALNLEQLLLLRGKLLHFESQFVDGVLFLILQPLRPLFEVLLLLELVLGLIPILVGKEVEAESLVLADGLLDFPPELVLEDWEHHRLL